MPSTSALARQAHLRRQYADTRPLFDILLQACGWLGAGSGCTWSDTCCSAPPRAFRRAVRTYKDMRLATAPRPTLPLQAYPAFLRPEWFDYESYLWAAELWYRWVA